MKVLLKFTFLILLCCFACNKTSEKDCPDGLEKGRIIGLDFRKCACCSGWWIEVGNDTLRTFTLPDNIAIADTNFVNGISIPVCLSYESSDDCSNFEELIDVKIMSLQ